MTAPDLGEIFAAPPTPFTNDGSLDPDRVPAAIEYAIEQRAEVIAIAGTGIQEVTAMDVEERTRMIATSMDAIPDDIPVFAGVSHPSMRHVTQLIEAAEGQGVDGLIAFPPWGIAPSPEEVRQYFTEISQEASVPILLYNNPRLTVDLPPELLEELVAIDGIQYLKETSRDLSKITALIRDIHHQGLAKVYTTMDVALITFILGGAGVIAPPPLTQPLAELRDAFERGELDHAADIQQRVASSPDVSKSPFAMVKAAAQVLGVDLGVPRPPLEPIGPAEHSSIEAWLEDLGISYESGSH